MRKRTSKGRFTKSRKSAKRRKRNGSRKLHHAARAAQAAHAPKRKSRKARKSRKSAKRRSRSGKHIRPTIIVARSGKYYRPRRSKYFKTARKVNGRRRRRHNGGKSIVSAIKNVFQVKTLTQYASIGGGIFAGTLLSRMLNTGMIPFTTQAIPKSVSDILAKIRPAHGLIHIALGTIVAAKSRNKYIKEAGLGLAALGGFDMLMQVLSKMGVANLPTFSGMNIDYRSAPRRVAGGMNVDLRSRRMAGMNVNLMGADTDAGGLADDLNAMLS